VFESLQEARRGQPRFVFYEGPPTANGRPGVHHVMARAVKDVMCRYHSLRGRNVERKAGWDTHGLPVEIEVEKKLGLTGKRQIEEYGVAEFNRKCRESVLEYMDLWPSSPVDGLLAGPRGRLHDPRQPLHRDGVVDPETVLGPGFMYEGHKILPYCPRCGTPLSSHEVAQGYEEVDDPSVFVRFRDADDPGVAFLVWTTTPWTLPSNAGLAVGPDFEYVEAELAGERLILARERLAALKGEPKILRSFQGSQLVGRRYAAPFDFFQSDPARAAAFTTPSAAAHDPARMWRVHAADFVSLETAPGSSTSRPPSARTTTSSAGASSSRCCSRSTAPGGSPARSARGPGSS